MTLSDAWVDFVAGWCSGAAAVLACQPVDTLLTRWQAGLVVSPAVDWRHATTSPSRAVSTLWRGASPMMCAVPLQNALLMGGYGVGQAYATRYAPEYRRTAVFWGGCTGGILQSFLMSPVEGVKVAQQCAGQSLRTAVLVSTAWQRGLAATLLRDGIPHGVWFVAYEECKDGLHMILGRDNNNNNNNNKEDPDPVLVPLLAGAGAATAAWAVGYPADVIKTRIQAHPNANLTILDTVRLLRAEANGSWWALYRGFGLKLVRSIPASMIGFTVYEAVKRYVLEMT